MFRNIIFVIMYHRHKLLDFIYNVRYPGNATGKLMGSRLDESIYWTLTSRKYKYLKHFKRLLEQ
jgi:hypothetical protein